MDQHVCTNKTKLLTPQTEACCTNGKKKCYYNKCMCSGATATKMVKLSVIPVTTIQSLQTVPVTGIITQFHHFSSAINNSELYFTIETT